MTLLPMTSLERVQRRLNDEQDPTAIDSERATLLGHLIEGVSAAIERWLALPLYIESRTETYDVPQFASELWLRSYSGARMPAPTITTVKVRTSWLTDWADVDAEEDTYALAGAQPGLLLFSRTLPAGRDNVQVVYIPGFAGPIASGEDMTDVTDAFVEAFPALADACEAQVAWEYHRRREPGQSSTSADGYTSSQQEIKLLRHVEERLAPYRRLVL